MPTEPVTVRTDTAALIEAAMPDGTQVYATPPEQLKAPAVVVGTTSWEPATQGSLKAVRWAVTIKLVVVRSAPAYNINQLEALSLDTARALLTGGYRVISFETNGTETIGGTDYLTGTLEIEYRTETN